MTQNYYITFGRFVQLWDGWTSVDCVSYTHNLLDSPCESDDGRIGPPLIGIMTSMTLLLSWLHQAFPDLGVQVVLQTLSTYSALHFYPPSSSPKEPKGTSSVQDTFKLKFTLDASGIA